MPVSFLWVKLAMQRAAWLVDPSSVSHFPRLMSPKSRLAQVKMSGELTQFVSLELRLSIEG